MKLIERPDWQHTAIPMFHQVRKGTSYASYNRLDQWFDTNLHNHYAIHKDDLVRYLGREDDRVWYRAEDQLNMERITHQAYLIKSSIEPIKQWKCPCGEAAMFADTEDCRTPLCHTCAYEIKSALEES